VELHGWDLERKLKRLALAIILLCSTGCLRRFQVVIVDPMTGEMHRLDRQNRDDAEKKAAVLNAIGAGQIVAWTQHVQKVDRPVAKSSIKDLIKDLQKTSQ